MQFPYVFLHLVKFHTSGDLYVSHYFGSICLPIPVRIIVQVLLFRAQQRVYSWPIQRELDEKFVSQPFCSCVMKVNEAMWTGEGSRAGSSIGTGIVDSVLFCLATVAVLLTQPHNMYLHFNEDICTG